MTDKVEGHLEVGHDETGEVVVNHPDLKPDANGVGHIVFSPNQARELAKLLLKHADDAEVEQIAAVQAKINKLEMGPKRWSAEIALRRVKVLCANYKHSEQEKTLAAWLQDLAEASKHKGVDWGSDQIRADYYEGQPETWLAHYDDGCTPDDAIDSDMECWSD